MRNILYVCIFIYPSFVLAKLPPNIINIANTCAYEKNISNDISYKSISDTTSYIEDDEFSKEQVFYIKDNQHVIGYAKSNVRSGFIYDKRFYSLLDIIPLNENLKYPNDIDYTLISWGYVLYHNNKYICANMSSSGIGESGRYQYIRHVMVFNVNDRKGVSYYYVKDTFK